jgi:hypothetical protein
MNAEDLFFTLANEIESDILCLCLIGLAKLHFEGKLGKTGEIANEALVELLAYVEERSGG